MAELLSWQTNIWASVSAQIKQGRLPHALMLTGAEGIGKSHFAEVLAMSALCDNKSENALPCQQCRNCHLFQVGTHPDIIRISLLEGKIRISVDQIRAANKFLQLSAQQGESKIVIISPAESMNVNAANSLLKTLEEPTSGSLLILTSNQPALLPATVRSRCQQLSFPLPDSQQALSWLSTQLTGPAVERETSRDTNRDISTELTLQLANGAPLQALKLLESDFINNRQKMLGDLDSLSKHDGDPISIAANWLKLGAKESLYWVYSWVADIIRLKSADNPPQLANPDFKQHLGNLANHCDTTQLFRLQEQIIEGLRRTGTSDNQQLLLEELLIFLKVTLKKAHN